METAGRWARLAAAPAPDAERVELFARAMLRRWGVVFRRLLARETGAPPWRELVKVYRRLEARGEIRGGRFVDGVGGEQFALPEAVGALRRARAGGDGDGPGDAIVVSAVDPLNLSGIVTPGPRVPARPRGRVVVAVA